MILRSEPFTLSTKYSFAKQVIDVSDAEDKIIKDWFRKIVKKNEHLMYEYSNYKSGSGATGTPKRAHNHALSSAMSHMQLGILLNDNKLFKTAFRNFEAAIKYQRKDGSMPIETRRGGRAMFYQARAMNALAVIATGPRNTMLHAPDVYMDKLAIGPGFKSDIVTLDMTPTERIKTLANAKNCEVSDITVCILERPRHEDLIEEVRHIGASIRLITDGDVAGVMHCAEAQKTGIDIYMGSGGAPEGVLAAAALKCMGGQIQGRLIFRNSDEETRAINAGIENLDKIYTRDEMVKADVIFAATGVTDGSLLSGIKRGTDFIETNTMLMRSKTGSVRYLNYRQKIHR